MLAPKRLMSLIDMQKLEIIPLIQAVGQLTRIEVMVGAAKQPITTDLNSDVDISLRNHFAAHYQRIADAASSASADFTKTAANRAVKQLRARGKSITYQEVSEINKNLDERLLDEFCSIQLYCIDRKAAEYYAPDEPLFGFEVSEVLAKANDDISEAGKCFGVGRYTASVFHLMRGMEVAVQVLSESLGIENVDREWGKLLSDIHGKIGHLPKGDERNRWSEVHANLYHVKQAWRNDTMHPKATYTEEEAGEVFDAMKAFMRNLANIVKNRT